MTRRRSLPVALAALLSAAVPACSDTEKASRDGTGSFPRKPIKVIVPFPAGGGSDTFVRIMQKAVRDQELLPQPLVVINVPGAGGTVGSRRARDAQADGYTILNLHEGILSSKYAGRVPYGPEAFKPIAATGQSGLVICVRDDSNFEDLTDLMTAAGEQPDRILFGMAPGTPTHFAGRRLETAGGNAKFRFVASGGGADRSNDLVGGHIDVTPFSLAEYFNYKPRGVRALAYLGESRDPGAPEISTAREQGYDVAMTHVQYWWAPKSTPDAAVQIIADVLEAAMATDYVAGKFAELRIQPLFLRGGELEAHLQAREGEFQNAALVRYEGLPNPVPSIAALAIVLAIGSTIRAKRRRPLTSEWLHGASVLAVLAAYVLAMQVAGLPYLFATIAFFPVIGIVAGARSRQSVLRLAGIGIALGWACFLIFTKLLIIDLP